MIDNLIETVRHMLEWNEHLRREVKETHLESYNLLVITWYHMEKIDLVDVEKWEHFKDEQGF